MRTIIAFLVIGLLLASPGTSAAAETARRAGSSLDGLQPLSAQQHAATMSALGSAYAHYLLQDGRAGWMAHDGDLVVPASLDLDINLVVFGDLRIEGDFDDDRGDGHLIVLGDLAVRDAFSWGALYVQGDLRATGVVFAEYNDFSFEVKGQVHARGLVLSDKGGDYRRGEIGFLLDDMDHGDDAWSKELGVALRVLQPEIFTDPEQLELQGEGSLHDLSPSISLARTWSREGRALLRETPAAEGLVDEVIAVLAPEASLQTLREAIGRDRLLPQLIAARADVPVSLHAALLELDDPVVNHGMAVVAPQATFARRRDTLTVAVAQRLVANPATDAQMLGEIAAHADAQVRATLADLDTLPAPLRAQLADDADASVRAAVLDPQLPAEVIARRAADTSLPVRRAAAALSLDADQVDALLRDDDLELRRALARGLRAQAQWRAPRRMDEAARSARAQRLLDDAAGIDDAFARRQLLTDAFLALSPQAQAQQLDALLRDVDLDEVAEHTASGAVMQHLVALADRHAQGVLPEKLGANPRLPPALQDEIIARAAAHDPADDDDRYADTPDDALEALLYNDAAPRIVDDARLLRIARLVLARGIEAADGGMQNAFFHYNGFSPEAIDAIGDRLRGDEDWALTVVLQPRATRAQLVPALRRWYEDDALHEELAALSALDDDAFWAALAKAGAADLRESAARSRYTAAATLATLLRDADDDVKYAACWNPNLPGAAAEAFLARGETCVLGNPSLSAKSLRAFADGAASAEQREQAWQALSLRLLRAE